MDDRTKYKPIDFGKYHSHFRKWTDPEQVYKEGIEYIEKTLEAQQPLTWTGLCIALDCTIDTFCEYEKGTYNTPEQNYSEPIKKLKQMVEMAYESRLQGNCPTGSIFALKNFRSVWRDESTINQNVKNMDVTEEDLEKLREKFGMTKPENDE